MATRQAQPTGQVASDPIPTDPGTTTSYSQPIGVPFYETNPRTGQPYIGPDGQPIRWRAPVEFTPTGPGSFGTAGPGTASSAVDPQSGQHVQFVAPRYFDGAQWLPASLSPVDVAALQKRMIAAGLLKSGEAQLGVWDTASVTAYTRLLAYANASGVDSGAALEQWDQAHALDPNAGKAPLTKQVLSLDELRPAIRKGFIETLGIGLSQDEVDHLATQYQALQSGAQQQAYNMQDAGGTVTAPPDPTTFAAARAREQDPQGAQAHDALGYQQEFFDLLRKWN